MTRSSYTLAATTLGTLQPGGTVNIECDMLAKHVAKLLAGRVDLAGFPGGLA